MNNNYLNAIIKDDKISLVEDFTKENLNECYVIKNKGSMVFSNYYLL